jgi:TRAP-type C4-dicarboxylate transport system permease small subunit
MDMNLHSIAAGFRKLEGVTTQLALAAAAAMLLGLSCVALWQVVARFVFHQPQAWSEVMVRTMMIWMVFLALGGSYKRGLMVSVDIVHRVVPVRIRTVLEYTVFVANIGVLSLLAWNGVLMAQRVSGQTIAGLGVSISWGYAAIPVGCSIALITVVSRFLSREADRVEVAEAY